jgi:serine/threonine-protein kinase RsbW
MRERASSAQRGQTSGRWVAVRNSTLRSHAVLGCPHHCRGTTRVIRVLQESVFERRAEVAASRIQKRVPADAAQVPCLRAAVNAFAAAHCGHADAIQFAVSLAVTEACTNVVRHAYPETPGVLALSAWADDDHLVVEVLDDGVGIDGVANAEPGTGLGLGLPLMYQLADTTIRSGDRGTHVELRFPRSSAD